MAAVPVRMLNQETAKVLARVKRGEEVEVTERGTVIARIVPVAGSRVAELVAKGKLRLPTLSGPIPHPRGPVQVEQEAGQVLREMRDDERF